MKYEPKTTELDREMMQSQNQPSRVYYQIIKDLYHAESVIAWQQGEIQKLQEQLRLEAVDSCCTDDDVRAEAKKVLPASYVDGNSYGVPDVTEIVCRLVAEVQRAKE